MWLELIRLARTPPAPWTLIGAHMVVLHAWAHGRSPIRPSRDADILVDVRALATATEKFSKALVDDGYQLNMNLVSVSGQGHNFRKGVVSVDVLAPDRLGDRARTKTIQSFHTVQVPGGRQALDRSAPTEVRTRSASGSLPLPGLLGAILIKARAINVAKERLAQQSDLALLLSLIDDVDVLRREATNRERDWLRRHDYLASSAHPAWSGITNAEDGAIAYRRLASE